MSRLPVLLLLAATCACGGGGEKASAASEAAEPTTAAPAGAETGTAAGAASHTSTEPGLDGSDPEPPDAQARAEQVAGAAWNADKTTALTMHITSLVDRTSGIEGFGTALAARETSVDERLDRLGAKVSGQEIVIRLPGAILFDFDRADLRADAERTLAEVAEVLTAYADRPARIEGHTDSIASEAYNQELSERRAEAVRAWLVARGVSPARLSAVGHGESRPVADNASAAGRQINRRVEIVIGPKG
jgi:outer membrane protein OmpA-like peptidoglycan-associated protein